MSIIVMQKQRQTKPCASSATAFPKVQPKKWPVIDNASSRIRVDVRRSSGHVLSVHRPSHYRTSKSPNFWRQENRSRIAPVCTTLDPLFSKPGPARRSHLVQALHRPSFFFFSPLQDIEGPWFLAPRRRDQCLLRSRHHRLSNAVLHLPRLMRSSITMDFPPREPSNRM